MRGMCDVIPNINNNNNNNNNNNATANDIAQTHENLQNDGRLYFCDIAAGSKGHNNTHVVLP